MNSNQSLDENSVCFIIGAPRSGTTILCDVLGHHPEIESLSEPYFIWDWMSGGGSDDVRTAADANPQTIEFIRGEFEWTLRKSGKKVLVEKTPENCFRVPFMQAIFPNAKWIFLYRDGRDVVSSMYKEWTTRAQMVEQRNVRQLARTAGRMLSRQRYWRNRGRALAHELRNNVSLRPGRFFNKAKWNGRAAWGPRFPGWEEALDAAPSDRAFNAMQWRESIRFAQRGIRALPPANVLHIRYEDLVSDRARVLEGVFQFLGVSKNSEVGEELASSSVGKWKTRFDHEALAEIEQVIANDLRDLGYEPVTAKETEQ